MEVRKAIGVPTNTAVMIVESSRDRSMFGDAMGRNVPTATDS